MGLGHRSTRLCRARVILPFLILATVSAAESESISEGMVLVVVGVVFPNPLSLEGSYSASFFQCPSLALAAAFP